MRVPEHGASGPWMAVLHGGPAAVGNAAPIARGLADIFRVLEPWQRGSGSEPLTVARHVSDLDDVVTARCSPARPALVGESWGAMLALAYAAEHPDAVGPIVLIGCGTFDTGARAQLRRTLGQRRTAEMDEEIAAIEADVANLDERSQRLYAVTRPLYDYAPLPDGPPDPEVAPFDMRAHTETWDDMLRRQQDGTYPAAFARIASPVLMLHGDYDPHPGPMIRDGLLPHIPHIEYHELTRCGHSPWNEALARDEFFRALRTWLLCRTG